MWRRQTGSSSTRTTTTATGGAERGWRRISTRQIGWRLSWAVVQHCGLPSAQPLARGGSCGVAAGMWWSGVWERAWSSLFSFRGRDLTCREKVPMQTELVAVHCSALGRRDSAQVAVDPLRLGIWPSAGWVKFWPGQLEPLELLGDSETAPRWGHGPSQKFWDRTVEDAASLGSTI